MKINLIGPLFSPSGYANHFKGLANALDKVADVKISTQLFSGWELACNDAELKMINKSDDPDRINIIIDMPFNWSSQANKKINIGFLVWEGDKIPISFLDCINNPRITQVWVPSNHVLNAVKDTTNDQLILNKIRICPHGVDLSVFKPILRENKEIFTFLCNKGFRSELDRGGMQYAIKAFIQEFSKGEARLFLKLNPAYAMSPIQLNEIIKKYVIEANKQGNFPDIGFSYDNLNQTQMNENYNNCDVLINPTEGEAFSLPCIESMACGKPVITTNFGGQTDFVTENNGWLVPFEPHEVKHEILYEGVKWGKPLLTELRKIMRYSFANKEQTKQKGVQAMETAKQWTWEISANKAIKLLSDIRATADISFNRNPYGP